MKRTPFVNIIIAALLALFTIVIGLLSSIATVELPSAIAPYLQFVWPVLGIVTLIFIGLTIWQTWRQAPSDHETLPKSEHYRQSVEEQNRQRMIAKVRSYWIVGVLEHSLSGELIALGLHERPDAVRLVLQRFDQSESELPPGTRITQVYEDAAGELLILGEPGSGKTTIMLELARNLLDRAEKDNVHPIPVIFNLASWATNRKPLTDWLIDELNTKYQMPRKLGQSWVNDNQILPLLDGLDEVVSSARIACIDAINSYRKEHGIVPTVVCSRRGEYMALTARLLLHNAVIIQPLTKRQIDDYLSSAGGQLAAVRVALHQDPDLQEMATSPLMLSILTLTYHGLPIDNLLAVRAPEARRKQVFATYIKRMLHRRGTETTYKIEQTMQWLSWLAKQMTKHQQTEFYIERMQPNWLPDSNSRRIYQIIVVKLYSGLLLGLSSGILIYILITSITWLSSWLPINPLLLALIGGLVVGLFVSRLNIVNQEIEPAENLSWSWVSLIQKVVDNKKEHLRIMLGGGILVGLVGLSYGLSIVLLVGILIGGLLGGLFSVLWDGLEGGFSFDKLPEHSLAVPNQGIWLSLRNSVLASLPLGLVSGLVVIWFGGLVAGVATTFILVMFLVQNRGADSLLDHFTLRWFLYHAGNIPWNFIRFLDYAADHILLRKVGGGYIFVHRLLLEYFASLDNTEE